MWIPQVLSSAQTYCAILKEWSFDFWKGFNHDHTVVAETRRTQTRAGGAWGITDRFKFVPVILSLLTFNKKDK